MQVNVDSIFDGLLPRVFVRKVTIDETGNYKKELNPHIDFEGEASLNSFKKTEQDKRNAELFGPSYFKQANSTSYDKQSKVTLDLVVKDSISTGASTLWLSDFNLQKYLNIYVCSTQDPGIVDKGKLAWFKKKGNSGGLSYFFDNVDGQSGVIKIPLNVRDTVQIDGRKIISSHDAGNAEFKTDKAGNRFIEFSFTAIDLPHNSYPAPNHLTYFIFTALDLQAMSTDYPDLQEVFPDAAQYGIDPEFISPITVQRVFDSHKLVRTSKIYLDPDGKMWIGKKHLFPNPGISADDPRFGTGFWMSGEPGDTDSKPLTERIVANRKIRDNRTFNFLEPGVFNFDTLFSDIGQRFSGRNKQLRGIVKGVNSANAATISDIWQSRDLTGKLRFCFAINFEEVLRQNSQFPVLLNNTHTRNNVLGRTKINRLKLIRRRLDKLNNVDSTDVLSLIDAPTESSKAVDVVLIEAKDQSYSLSGLSAKTAMAEINVKTDLAANSSNTVRYYTGCDMSMAATAYGSYQYTLELDMEDGTIPYFQDLYSTLKHECRDNMLRYYNEAMYMSRKTRRLDRFPEDFIEKFSEIFTGNWAQAGWFDIGKVIAYAIDCLDTMYALSGTQSFNYDKDDLVAAIAGNISPTSGSPRGIELFLDFINKMMSSIESLIGHKNLNTDSPLNSAGSRNTSTIRKDPKIFSIKHTFRKHYKKRANNLGVDYIIPFDPAEGEAKLNEILDGPTEGLRTFTARDLQNRMQQELERYFTEEFAGQIMSGQLPDMPEGFNFNAGATSGTMSTHQNVPSPPTHSQKLLGFVAKFYKEIALDSFTYFGPSIFRFTDGSNLYVNYFLESLDEQKTNWATLLVTKIILENSHHHDTCHEFQYSDSLIRNVAAKLPAGVDQPKANTEDFVLWQNTKKVMADPRYGSCTINVKLNDPQVSSLLAVSSASNSSTVISNMSLQEQYDYYNKIMPGFVAPSPEVLEHSLAATRDSKSSAMPIMSSLLGAKIFDAIRKNPLMAAFTLLGVNQITTGALAIHGDEHVGSAQWAGAFTSVPNHIKQLFLSLTNYISLTRPIFEKPSHGDRIPSNSSLLTEQNNSEEQSLEELEKQLIYMLSPDNFATAWLFYQNFVRLEYFDGFEQVGRPHGGSSTTRVLMKREMWKPLNGVLAASLTGKRVLCRIRKVQNQELANLGVNFDKLDMPIYNEYFFLYIPATFEAFTAFTTPDTQKNTTNSGQGSANQGWGSGGNSDYMEAKIGFGADGSVGGTMLSVQSIPTQLIISNDDKDFLQTGFEATHEDLGTDGNPDYDPAADPFEGPRGAGY